MLRILTDHTLANLGDIQSLLALNQVTNDGVTSMLGPTRAYISCSDANYQKTRNAQDIDPAKPAGQTTLEACESFNECKLGYPYMDEPPVPYMADQGPVGPPYVWYIPTNVSPGPSTTNAAGVNRRVFRDQKQPPNAPEPASLCAGTVTAITAIQSFTTEDQPLTQIVLCPNFWADYPQRIASVTPQPDPKVDTVIYPTYQFAGSALVHELFHILGDQCK